jgi:hypothetical protein
MSAERVSVVESMNVAVSVNVGETVTRLIGLARTQASFPIRIAPLRANASRSAMTLARVGSWPPVD